MYVGGCGKLSGGGTFKASAIYNKLLSVPQNSLLSKELLKEVLKLKLYWYCLKTKRFHSWKI